MHMKIIWKLNIILHTTHTQLETRKARDKKKTKTKEAARGEHAKYK